MSDSCTFAKSDMTPCVLKDGVVAMADDGCCVGCGRMCAPSVTEYTGDLSLNAKRPDVITDLPHDVE